MSLQASTFVQSLPGFFRYANCTHFSDDGNPQTRKHWRMAACTKQAAGPHRSHHSTDSPPGRMHVFVLSNELRYRTRCKSTGESTHRRAPRCGISHGHSTSSHRPCSSVEREPHTGGGPRASKLWRSNVDRVTNSGIGHVELSGCPP